MIMCYTITTTMCNYQRIKQKHTKLIETASANIAC